MCSTTASNEPVGAVALEISDDQVQTIRAISNPEKIRHLRRRPIDVDLAASWERGQDPHLIPGHALSRS